MTFNIQPADFPRISNEVAIAVRCTGKSEIPERNLRYVKEDVHPFSICDHSCRIPENKATGMLYAELNAIKTTLKKYCRIKQVKEYSTR